MLCMKDIIKLILEIINKMLDIIAKLNLFNSPKYLYIKEENIRIDCTHFLQQVAKQNKDLIPFRVNIKYYISKDNCITNRILEAKCNSKSYSSYEFSIASTIIKKYEETECFGYDLNYHPEIKIRPQLISPDGFSKRLSLQLNRTLHKGENFKVHIQYKSYGTMCGHQRYIVNGCNYKKNNLIEYIVMFKFEGEIPDDIRVYEIDLLNRRYRFLHKIFPDSNGSFIDNYDTSNIKCNKRYIYVF